MPRIQTFVSNQVREEIESLVTERRQEGGDGKRCYGIVCYFNAYRTRSQSIQDSERKEGEWF